jgi:hypothetical protein
VDGAHDDLAEVSLVDEELGLSRLRDPKLDRLLSDRSHQDPAARSKRPDELDTLDVAVPLRPSGDVGPDSPDLVGRRARLDTVLTRPHRSLLLPGFVS